MGARVIFHEFDPCIYPRKVWIVREAAEATIAERFDADTKYIEDFKINDDSCIAVCLPVIQKKTKLKGILCNVVSPRSFGVGHIAHESVHIADYIFDECGACVQEFKATNEPFAYLTGWVADCFTQAK